MCSSNLSLKLTVLGSSLCPVKMSLINIGIYFNNSKSSSGS